jgi:hypothetical protein
VAKFPVPDTFMVDLCSSGIPGFTSQKNAVGSPYLQVLHLLNAFNDQKSLEKEIAPFLNVFRLFLLVIAP